MKHALNILAERGILFESIPSNAGSANNIDLGHGVIANVIHKTKANALLDLSNHNPVFLPQSNTLKIKASTNDEYIITSGYSRTYDAKTPLEYLKREFIYIVDEWDNKSETEYDLDEGYSQQIIASNSNLITPVLGLKEVIDNIDPKYKSKNTALYLLKEKFLQTEEIGISDTIKNEIIIKNVLALVGEDKKIINDILRIYALTSSYEAAVSAYETYGLHQDTVEMEF